MKTGIVGLGAMGSNMARNLAKAGHLVTVFNRTLSTAESIAKECGCSISKSLPSLAKQCEIIIICVSCDRNVIDIVDTIKTSINANTIVVDTSTVSSDTAKQAASILKEYDSYFLDCPVSGGVEGAKNGSLAMMVGGNEVILRRARNTLGSIASKIIHIGSTGSGQATKAVNQIMAAGINQAVTEALAFGQAMGLPMDKVIDVISTGAAGCWFLEHRGKTMLAGNYEPGFKLALHYKDLLICQSMTNSISDNDLPIIEMTLLHYRRLIDEGFGDEDISTLFRLKQEKLS